VLVPLKAGRAATHLHYCMIQKTKKIKRGSSFKTVFFSVLILLLIFFFIGFLIVSNWRINQRRGELISQIKILEKAIEELEKKNQELKAGMSQFSDEGYLEKEAREKLGLKKPGEEVVVVLPPPEKEEETKEEKGFWQKIWEKLGF